MGRLTRNRLIAAIGCVAFSLALIAGTAIRAAAPIPGPAGGQEPPVQRSAADVQALVAEAGKNPPAWLERVPLDYPQTLDLTWKKVAPGWKPNRNLDTHLFAVICKNEPNLRRGVKLMHHVLEVNKDDAARNKRTMKELARLYVHVQEYAHAAYWFEKAGASDAKDLLALAYCYHRLGSAQLASAAGNRMMRGRRVPVETIEILAEMGKLQAALTLAGRMSNTGISDAVFLAAGNACRHAGRYVDALDYYRQVLSVGKGTGRIKRNKERARESIAALTGFDKLELAGLPDGSYAGESKGYRGPVKVEVTVKGGRIEDVKVVGHREDRTLGGEVTTARRIVRLQGIKGVDAVTGASTTSDAIVNAAAKALKSGRR